MLVMMMKSTVILISERVQVQTLILSVEDAEALKGARVHAGRVKRKLERLLRGSERRRKRETRRDNKTNFLMKQPVRRTLRESGHKDKEAR